MSRGRLAAVGAAVAVLLWSGLQVAQLRARQHADTIAARLPSADAGHARSLLRFSRALHLDRRADLVQARVEVGARRPGRAIGLVRDVLGKEPDNIVAWTQLGLIARERSPALTRRAVREVRRLSPPVGG